MVLLLDLELEGALGREARTVESFRRSAHEAWVATTQRGSCASAKQQSRELDSGVAMKADFFCLAH